MGEVVRCTCDAPEEWRPVDGWPYQVSSHGRVIHEREGAEPRALSGDPYLLVHLSNAPESAVFVVHRLVATAFLGEPPTPTHQVNHLDGVKRHNCDGNLEWVTPSENVQHAFETGLRSGDDRKGELHPLAKLTEEVVIEARHEYLTTDVYAKDLAERYGVSPACMMDAIKGKTWGHLPGAVENRRAVRCAS